MLSYEMDLSVKGFSDTKAADYLFDSRTTLPKHREREMREFDKSERPVIQKSIGSHMQLTT